MEVTSRFDTIKKRINSFKISSADDFSIKLKIIIKNNDKPYEIDDIIVIFNIIVQYIDYLFMIPHKDKMIDALKQSIIRLKTQVMDHSTNPHIDQEKYPECMRIRCIELLNHTNNLISYRE
jgi:hypothetical protein